MNIKYSSISIMFTIFMLLALLVGLPAIAQPALAEPYIVTNTNNSGPGSLRQAIEDAKLNPGPDTITFDPLIDGSAIELMGGADEDANASGDLDILDSENLTIQGNGVANTIIDGGGNDRVFHICPGGGCTNTVILEGVTIQNGSASLLGGGIYNEGGTTTLDGCTVSLNSATYGSGIYNEATLNIRNGSTIGGTGATNTASVSGGGILNALNGTTVVDGSAVSANSAKYGGGIYNQATLTVTNSTIGGIGAGNTAYINGGGIQNDNGTATVDGSAVSANTSAYGGGISNNSTLYIQNGSIIGGPGVTNTATTDGGGIINWSGTTLVDDSTIRNNTATKNGGGIFIRGGSTTVDDSVISANTAHNGGGIYNEATLYIHNGSTIGGENTAISSGGGLFNATDGTATVDGSTVSANTAGGGAGGIRNNGTLHIQNGSTIGGAGSGNEGGGGGGITNMSGTTTVDSSAINANTAVNGGGIYNYSGTTTVTSSTVNANTASHFGGGIYNQYGTVTVDSSSVSANTATYSGGGIYNYEPNITSANTAIQGNDFENATILRVQNGSTVSANMASQDGGGIYNRRATTMVDNSTISANKATDKGGGIHNYIDTTTVDDSTVSANTATDGGGIYNKIGTTMVTGSRILNNIATTSGGGVYNEGNVPAIVDIRLSCIVGNTHISFINTVTALQMATNNWWGAATGPDTPGADTTGGAIDTSSFLTAPTLGCTPDLQVTKENDTGGEAKAGTPFHWTLVISNTGLTNADFDTGQTILVDDLPPSPTYGTPVVANVTNITNGGNIDCSIASDTLSCEAGGGGVIVGADGSFTVAFSVTPNEVGALINPAGICRVDPDGTVFEGDEADNNCPTDIVDVRMRYLYMPLILK